MWDYMSAVFEWTILLPRKLIWSHSGLFCATGNKNVISCWRKICKLAAQISNRQQLFGILGPKLPPNCDETPLAPGAKDSAYCRGSFCRIRRPQDEGREGTVKGIAIGCRRWLQISLSWFPTNSSGNDAIGMGENSRSWFIYMNIRSHRSSTSWTFVGAWKATWKALDQPFNPEHHEAMFAMEMPGKVAETWWAGGFAIEKWGNIATDAICYINHEYESDIDVTRCLI